MKYAKATGTAMFIVGGVTLLTAAVSRIRDWCPGSDWRFVVLWGFGCLAVGVLHWPFLVRWRLRVFARDLAHGLAAPTSSTRKGEG